MKFLILFGMCAGAFYLVDSGKAKTAMKLLVLTLPFMASPFHSDGVMIGLSGFLVVSVWIGLEIKNSVEHVIPSWRTFSWKSLLYYFLFIGVVLGLTHNSYSFAYYRPDSLISPQLQVFDVSAFIIITILFIEILSVYQSDFNFQLELLYAFVASSFLQLLSILLYVLGYYKFLPLFLRATPAAFVNSASRIDNIRFAGLLDDYELIVDYCMMVIGFSLVLWVMGKNKLVLSAALISSIIIGIFSGTRSFLVVVVLFFIALILAVTVSSENVIASVKRLLTYSLLFSVFVLIGYLLLRNSMIFDRMQVAYNLFESGEGVQTAANRDILAAIPIVLRQSGVLGNGSLFLNSINGNIMVRHDVFLATYAKFGVVGLVTLLVVLIKLFKDLLVILIQKHSKKVKDVAAIFLALLFALCLEETKISALRYLSSILFYSFFLLVTSFFIRLVKSGSLSAVDSVSRNSP